MVNRLVRIGVLGWERGLLVRCAVMHDAFQIWYVTQWRSLSCCPQLNSNLLSMLYSRSLSSSMPPKDAYTHLSHFEEPPSPFSEKINNRFLVERMEEDDPDTPRRFEPESSTRRVISPKEKWFDAIRCLLMVSDSAKKCRITSDNSDNLRNFRC